MKFSEHEHQWREPIPGWVTYLMRFGYAFAEKAESNRISLISMPCDSPGAGLAALGAMRYYLSLQPLGDDVIIERLENERNKTIIHPRFGQCLYIEEIEGMVELQEIIPPRIAKPNHQGPVTVQTGLQNLRFIDEPYFKSSPELQLPLLFMYKKLIKDAQPVLKENLRQSSSSVCIAGRARGMSITREFLSQTRFGQPGQEADLRQLLSLIDGSLDTVSRVTAYNTRTGKSDRCGLPPKILVVDGIDAFLKVLEEMQRNRKNKFSSCSIIAVIDRTEKREKLDALKVKVSELRQWYELDSEKFPGLPKGISLATYLKRTGL